MNKSTFASASPDEKKSIRRGVVETGFTPDLVYLALGRPDKVRGFQGGRHVEWVYFEYDAISTGDGYYYSSGRPDDLPSPLPMLTPEFRVTEIIRVTFRDGKVTGVWQASAYASRSVDFADYLRKRSSGQASATSSVAQRDTSPTAASPRAAYRPSPGILDMRRSRFLETYGAFFRKHPMPDEQKEKIRVAVQDAMDFRLDPLTRQKIPSAVERAAESERRLETDLKGLLGEEVFKALLAYRVTLLYRRTAERIAGQMRLYSDKLSDEQIEQLVLIFKQYRVIFIRDVTGTSEHSLRHFASVESSVMEAAGKILNKRQMEFMKRFWKEKMAPATARAG